MFDKKIEDAEKQKVLLQNITKQLKLLAALIIKIVLLISPFVVLSLLPLIKIPFDIRFLYSLKGILFSLIIILFYVFAKIIYGKLFSVR